MFYQLITAILGASLLGAVLLAVGTILKTVAVKRDFEKRGQGLKIADKFSILNGHVNSYFFHEGQMYLVEDLFRQFRVKTVGALYGWTKVAVTVDLDLVKQIALDHQENDRMCLKVPVKEIEIDCILTAPVDQWRGIRKAFAPALKSNKFKTPNVQREIDGSIVKLIKAIDSKLNATQQSEIELNVDDYAHRYSLDLVFRCFYKQDNLIDFDAEVDPMTEVTESGYEAFMWSPLVRLCVVFPILKSTVDWLALKFHKQGVWRKMLMDFVKQQTKLNLEARKHLQRLKAAGKKVDDEDNFTLADGTTKFRRNMIDHVIDQFYEGKLTKTEYFHTTWFLMSAADKTASDAIAHTLYQLATHSDVQDKLRKSISAEGVDSEYLSWVINESLRILPPVSIGCARMTSRDYKCEDGIVPAGTFVVPAAYSIHRLEKYWGPDAEEFRPERFADAKSFHPLQFLPFGTGARGCPGKEFALHEIKKLLCSLLTLYKFHCEPQELTYSSPFFFLQLPNKHVHIKVSRI